MPYLGTQPNDVKKNTGLYTPSEILQLTKDGSWGGSLELIAEQTADGTSTSLNFTDIKENIYDVHLLQVHSMFTSSANKLIRIRLSNDGGSSFIASGYQYAYQIMQSNGSFSEQRSTSETFINVHTNVGTVLLESANFYVYFYNLGNSSKYSFLNHQSSNMDNTGTILGSTFGGGVLPTAETHNAIQLIEPNLLGNLTGTAKLYGVKQI